MVCCDTTLPRALPRQHVYSRMTWSPMPKPPTTTSSSPALSHPLLLTLSLDNPTSLPLKLFPLPSLPLQVFFPSTTLRSRSLHQLQTQSIVKPQHLIPFDWGDEDIIYADISFHGIFANWLHLRAILHFPSSRITAPTSDANPTPWHLSIAIHTTHKQTTTSPDQHSARDPATAPSAQL